MSGPDGADIRRLLHDSAVDRLDEIDTFASIDSTNTYLLQQPPPGPGRMRVAIAGEQTAGRGRHSRRWVSPAGTGLYLSIAHTYADRPEQLPALTLALGVGVVDALAGLDVEGVGLKWPNDIVARDGKLGGILTEVAAGSAAGITVVGGIGINLDLAGELEPGDASGWTLRPVDVAALTTAVPARETLAASIIDRFADTFTRFGASGFASFAEDWRRRDWLFGRTIIANTPGGAVTGVAEGVDADGALIVTTAAGTTRVVSGSIELAAPREAVR